MNIPTCRPLRSPLVVLAAALLCTGGQAAVPALQADTPGRPLLALRVAACLASDTPQPCSSHESHPTLGHRLAAMAGTDLTLAVCRQRMQDVDTLLREAGYGDVRIHTLSDGTLVARWYHTGRQMTALAFSGQHSAGNAFSVQEYAGMIRWNELGALP